MSNIVAYGLVALAIGLFIIALCAFIARERA